MSADLKRGRFVVLEHEWRGVHWDVMLEDGDALRTWAVDAPIVAGAELPARALPAHRTAYLSYEGPVSNNRGRVRRVAQGRFRALEWGTDRVRVVLDGDQLVGEVTLERAGSVAGSSSSSYPAVAAEPWKFRLGKVD